MQSIKVVYDISRQIRRSIAILSLFPSLLAAQAKEQAWEIVSLPQASEIFARDGSLIGEIGSQIRTSVSIRTLPRYVGQAFIAVEDQRFYQHNGVDVEGVARAAIKNIDAGEIVQGGSTITMQLMRNL
ncbi:MAG TPA: biosynthetic peptidoglycan transglycosylase, partial [Gemmatimonadaceae bacterium]|nr:biosynthetic peptidoglycan transglycosylase [Gemmatimonadaceae bacterium]